MPGLGFSSQVCDLRNQILRKGYGRFRKKDLKIRESYERLYYGKKKKFFEKMV